MKQIFVKDIKPGNSISNTPFVVVKAEKKVAKNGKEYLDVTLGDSTGTILCKVWSEKYDACSADVLKEGVIVSATGSATEFMGKTQMVLTMAIITEQYAEEDFVPVTKKNVDQMLTDLNNFIASIQDTHLHKLLSNMFTDQEFLKVYKRTPAGMKLHHDYVGGLLEHTLELIRFAEPMCELYQPCNRDLVIAGCIVHDIGKIEELVWKNMSIQYSDKGKLLDHIPLALEIIKKYRPDGFDEDCWMLLQHIIISHQGKTDHGSIVVPATLEARIVSLADDASYTLNYYMGLYEDGIRSNNGNSFSEYSRVFETNVYLKSYNSALRKHAEIVNEQKTEPDQPSLLDFNS